jgi:hypothetical protein
VVPLVVSLVYRCACRVGIGLKARFIAVDSKGGCERKDGRGRGEKGVKMHSFATCCVGFLRQYKYQAMGPSAGSLTLYTVGIL